MTLEEKLQEDLEATIQELNDLKIGSSRFQQMLAENGGVDTAKILLQKKELSEGLIDLFDIGRQDLSVEHIALKPEYQEIFTETELAEAKRRLGR